MSTAQKTELLRPDAVSFPRAYLTVMNGPEKGRAVILEGQTVTVGSDEACQLRLSDPAVSRRHFELSGGPGGYRLRDLRSTNGVFVESVQVLECRLNGRARIQVGRTELKFEPARQTVQWPLSPTDRFGEALGGSTAMRRVFAVLERAAESEASLVLEGEPGTGKELLAREVHLRSARKEHPFVAVDVSSLPEVAAEAALFGQPGKPGAIADAERGTLFLDEVSQLSLPFQARLLRTLEGNTGRGPGNAPNVRLMGSTTRDLEAEVAAGRFRQDLYFKLSALRVRVPPLRERREDVPMLVRKFESRRANGEPLPAQTIEMLGNHDWSGNVRELRSVVERLAAFPDLGEAALEKVLGDAPGRPPPSSRASSGHAELLALPFHEARDRVVEAFEKSYLTEHLRLAQGVVTHAAQRIGLPRQSLHRMLRRLGLSSGDESEG